MGQIGAVAGHHRRQHRGVVLAQAQRRGQISHRRRQRQQPRRRRVLPPAYSAREKRARRLPQPVYAVNCNRCRRRDSLVQQIIRAAPYARIVIGLRPQQANNGPHPLAASERLRANFLRIHRPTNRQPHAACNRRLRIALVVYHFNCRHAQIDSLRRRSRLGLVDILLELSADGPRIHHGPFNRSRQSV